MFRFVSKKVYIRAVVYTLLYVFVTSLKLKTLKISYRFKHEETLVEHVIIIRLL